MGSTDRFNQHCLNEICSANSLAPAATEPLFNALLPLDKLEQHYLRWALATHPGDKRSLARALGISERTLYRKLEKA